MLSNFEDIENLIEELLDGIPRHRLSNRAWCVLMILKFTEREYAKKFSEEVVCVASEILYEESVCIE